MLTFLCSILGFLILNHLFLYFKNNRIAYLEEINFSKKDQQKFDECRNLILLSRDNLKIQLMKMSSKPRVVKDYAKLDKRVKQLIKLNYPEGFEDHLIKFQNKDGNTVSALPFETEEYYYLIRMTISQAQEIIEDDDDYDDEGFLKEEIKEEYEENIDEEFE